jgi:hypothetical protein
MSIVKDALRAKTGQSLTDMNNQAISAIAQLEGIKTNLLNLKSSVKTDTANFTAEDETEVNAIITGLATKIQALLN